MADSLSFLGQLIIAILIADFGITTVHLVSHRVGWMWRLHAVHHSIRRSYGLNGLMKHPLHQSLETIGGVAPLLLLGMPVHVAASLAGCVAIQLLMQHSNVAYRVGPLRLVPRWAGTPPRTASNRRGDHAAPGAAVAADCAGRDGARRHRSGSGRRVGVRPDAEHGDRSCAGMASGSHGQFCGWLLIGSVPVIRAIRGCGSRS